MKTTFTFDNGKLRISGEMDARQVMARRVKQYVSETFDESVKVSNGPSGSVLTVDGWGRQEWSLTLGELRNEGLIN
jgi:hypothetical protein